MLDMLQKGLLTGLGVALITREKVMEATRNLVEEGKITAEEAEELANDLLDEGRRQWKEMQGKITTAQFYFERILPRAEAHARAATAGAGSTMALEESQFHL